jgi:hypothetical protein
MRKPISCIRRSFSMWLQFKLVISLVLICALLFLTACLKKQEQLLVPTPGKGLFWLETQANQLIDEQVVNFLAKNAAVLVLRTPLQGPIDSYNRSALINHLHKAAPSLPVLLYTWVSLYFTKGGHSGTEAMDWLAKQPKLQILSLKGTPIPPFGNVMSPDYRKQVVNATIKTLDQSGADGVAIDLAFRTPRFQPEPLAKQCATYPEFCKQYARGMDILFAELSGALGERSLLYNGLWNFGKGMPDDQLKLLKHADSAIVEYFGMNPRENEHSFSKDILPYLKIMQSLEPDKQLFVFGRGPWIYTDYQEDYLWQRYLYCAFLLAKKKNTLFKYHASFQVPAHAGRSGGLDVYADWQIDLGEPEGSYQVKNGLYIRKFKKGLVVVAPDESEGGKLTLDTPVYTPEGKQIRGKVELSAGEGKLLLKKRLNGGSSAYMADAQHSDLLLNHWQDARVIKDEGRGAPYMRLSNVTKALAGEHDLLLSPIRFLRMPDILNLKVRLQEPSARVLLVAEVDDPKRCANLAVIELATEKNVPLKDKGAPVLFRAPSSKSAGWPYIPGPRLATGQWQELKLDGNKLLQQFRFKRWSHVRFVGGVDVMYAFVSKKN